MASASAELTNLSSPPPNVLLLAAELLNLVERYLPEEESQKVYRAFLRAHEAHKDVVRRSGDPYITHPLTVAHILADLHVDADTLCAALLHDVIEDTTLTCDDLATEFGEVVAKLVDGVTKLDEAGFADKQTATIHSFQKMMEAMTDDFRVVLIKLADRLHNLRTLSFKKQTSRQRIAQETVNIYIPLAQRLGMNAIRREMQLLVFEHLHPWRSKILERALRSYQEEHQSMADEVFFQVNDALAEFLPGSSVMTWAKNPIRLYERMRRQGKHYDISREKLELRILTGTKEDCYQAMGVVHELFSPKPGEIFDFIANPRTYGFQALQTTVVTPSTLEVRFMVQTRSMFQVMQYGVAAQWRYPDLNAARKAEITQTALNEWLGRVRDLGDQADNAHEFYADMQADLFVSEVYAFTPKGEMHEFPAGAVVLDFAYAIHTQVGDHASGAMVNGELVGLHSPIPNGATINILTDERVFPQDSWLSYVVTARARSRIRSHLRAQKQNERLKLGMHLFGKALADTNLVEADIDFEQFAFLRKSLGYEDDNTLYLAFASGESSPWIFVNRLFGLHQDLPQTDGSPVLVSGSTGLAVQFGGCCHPIPGDTISASIDAGIGLSVHRNTCPVFSKTIENKHRIAVNWADTRAGETFSVLFGVKVYNRVGVLSLVTQTLAKLNINIEDINTAGEGAVKENRFKIKVSDTAQLSEVSEQIRSLADVIKVERLFASANAQ